MRCMFRFALGLGIVCCGPATLRGQIPEGFEVLRIATGSDVIFKAPHINSAGTVVWNVQYSAVDSRVFRYRDGKTEQVTAGFAFENFARIDDLGRMGWVSAEDGNDPTVVTVLDASGAHVLPGEPVALEMTLGNGGQIIWTHPFGDPNDNHWELFGRNLHGYAQLLAPEVRFTQLTDNGLANASARVNRSGEIVWTAFDFHVNPWTSTIKLYSDGVIRDLTEGPRQVSGPDINDHGVAVWGSGTDGIELWEDGEVRVITDDGRGPKINNLGQIAFNRWHDDIGRWHVWLYSDGEIRRLTDPMAHPDLSFFRPSINDRGEMCWGSLDAKTFEKGIWLMRRISPSIPLVPPAEGGKNGKPLRGDAK